MFAEQLHFSSFYRTQFEFEFAILISEKDKGAGKYSTPIDTKEFNAGMYFITLSDGNTITTQKVMIQR